MSTITEALRKLNPWWADKGWLINETIERTVQKEVFDLLKIKSAKDIIGVRRSGKTTLLYLVITELIKENVKPSSIFFLTLDDINLRTAKFGDIENEIYQINPNPEYLFLDEAQEKKDWEVWVKQLYDSKKFKQIFISGSNASLLSKDVGTLLTGRHITTIVFPFSFKEFLVAQGWNNFSNEFLSIEKNKVMHYLNRYLKEGGFPETLNVDQDLSFRMLSNIYNDIISRDIASRYSIDKDKIDRFAKYLFTNIANEYSYNSLARAVDINVETAEKYLNYLQESFLLFSLGIFSHKLKLQYKKSKKIYSIDTGLRNSIAFRFSEDIGKIYENAVFLELKRRYKEVYYWKNERSEVDFVIKEGFNIKEAIQVCYGFTKDKTKSREIKSAIDCAKELKLKEVKIITEDNEDEENAEGLKIMFIPLWKWLLVRDP